jgi:hypothetical protein
VTITTLERPASDTTWEPGKNLPHPIQLLPWLEELSILTRDLTTARLGDVLNDPQRKFIAKCQRQLDNTGRIRQVVLKARQMGFSTIIEGIGFIMAMRLQGMNGRVIAHREDAAENILKMTKRYWRTYPFRRYHIEEYGGKKQLSWADRQSSIEVMTAGARGGGRSSTLQFAHCSEVAFWLEPEELMKGLRQTIPSFGCTAIFLESTANGIGNYFHAACTAARKGTSEFEFNFHAWHELPEYTAAYIDAEDRAKYTIDMTSLDKEEQSLVKRFNIDMGQILWRRYAIENLCNGDVEVFHQEYPSDPDEAFVSTGRNVFPLPLIIAHAELEYGIRGKLTRNRKQTPEFHQDDQGFLTIYRPPHRDKEWGVYLIGADPTHTTAGDNACAQVINRRTLEQVAVFRRKTDPITFAKDLELLGRYYNDAFIAPEKEGPGYATVGALVASNYPFIYQHQNIAKAQGQGVPHDTFGWSTNVATKHLAISHLLRAIKDPLSIIGETKYGLVIHDEQTAAEMRDYVTTEDGRGYTNSDGSLYDDGVMALAIGLAVHNIEPPVPAYVGRASHELPANVANRPVSARPMAGAAAVLHEPPPEPPEPDDDHGDSGEKELPWERWGRSDKDI